MRKTILTICFVITFAFSAFGFDPPWFAYDQNNNLIHHCGGQPKYLNLAANQFPYTTPSAIEIENVFRVTFDDGVNAPETRYIEPHLSQGNVSTAVPGCGTVNVRLVLDPVSDGNGGYIDGVKVGNLQNRYPEFYAGHTWTMNPTVATVVSLTVTTSTPDSNSYSWLLYGS